MATSQRIRVPAGLAGPGSLPESTSAGEPAAADRETLRQIVLGLDELEKRVEESPVFGPASERGYFTPDEDDRVRQGLLVYRNYRLAAYEIILRYRNYGRIEDEAERLRYFILAYSAALVLYAKSLKIIQVAEHSPLLRSKLNEPDAKFELGPGFFDDVLAGYSSLVNYRALMEGEIFWRRCRRRVHELRFDRDPHWEWLIDVIRNQRRIVRERLLHVLAQRLRYDWRAFWRSTVWPVRQARSGLQLLLGRRFAGAHLATESTHVLTPAVLSSLRPQLRPGDILLCRAEGKLTAALLPGFWCHAAIFLGSCADLEPLGLRDHPYAARHWAELSGSPGALGLVIESVCPKVQLSPLETSICADHVVVLRPRLPAEQLAAALGEAMGHLGKPYDFEFDFSVSTRLVCTALVNRSYHGRGGIEFPLVKRLGRFTLAGDDILQVTLEQLAKPSPPHPACLEPVALILKRRDGEAHAVPPGRIVPLLRRIRDGWRPARHCKR